MITVTGAVSEPSEALREAFHRREHAGCFACGYVAARIGALDCADIARPCPECVGTAAELLSGADSRV